jgi:DNA repair exonuclease SbcCD ATPase subunit
MGLAALAAGTCCNTPMSAEIEQQLAAAAQAAREYELCGQQHAQLSAREQAAAADLEAARQQYAGNEKDVHKLEQLSLTRVLAALHGTRQDALAREKAEADAASYRVAQAQQRLEGVRAQLASLADRQGQLAGAPQAYADALAAKEQYLTHSADPRRARLLTLADEHGQLTAELNELRRASGDAGAAVQALAEVHDRLGTAANWSTFDTYFDHGMVANAIKHDRIDQAAQAAQEADQRLAALRSDLADLGGSEPTAPRLEISSGFKFADIFFNNIFTDLAVGQHIVDAQGNVDRSVQQVRALQDRLKDQIGAVTGKLNTVEAERQHLLTQ